MKVKNAIIEALNNENVRYCFTLSADHILSLLREIENVGTPRTIHAACELGAGFMSIAYSRVSGEVGVNVLVGGPGVLNAVNPIAMAYVEGDPLLVIASTPPRNIAYKNCLHAFPSDTDQIGVFKTITKRQFKVTSASQIPQILSKAFNTALSGKPGPVYIEIPADMFDEDIGVIEYLKIPSTRPQPPDNLVLEVLKLIQRSEKPVILAGRGVIISRAERELVDVAEYFDIPVCTTIMGKGAISPTHPLYAGTAAGAWGDIVANEVLSEADLVMALGVRFSQIGTGGYSMKIKGNLIHVNISSDEFDRVFKPTLAIEADIKMFLSKLLSIAKHEGVGKISRGTSERLSRLWAQAKVVEMHEKTTISELIEPWEVVKLLRGLLDEDAIIACDIGAHRFETFTMPIYKPRTFVTSTSYASVGMGVPSAIGAQIARRDVKVVGLVGDGGFLMTGLEIITAVRYNLPVIIVVFNDSAYRILRIYERVNYGSERLSHKLPPVNFAELAKALGSQGIRIENRDELRNGIEKALSMTKDKPVVVDVLINPESIPLPMRRLYGVKLISEIGNRAKTRG